LIVVENDHQLDLGGLGETEAETDGARRKPVLFQICGRRPACIAGAAEKESVS
jgi:hypothetical protein